MKYFSCLLVTLTSITSWSTHCVAEEDSGNLFVEQVAPLLNKYCVGCHNIDDAAGKLQLDSYQAILQGGKRGAVINFDDIESSRLLRVLTGAARPMMPPAGEARPTENELAVLMAWLEQGAQGPNGKLPDRTMLIAPAIQPTSPVRNSISSIAVASNGDRLATGRYGRVTLSTLSSGAAQFDWQNIQGNVNSVSFSQDGELVAAAAGEPGLIGEARIWNANSGKLLHLFRGHRDSLYAAQLTPNKQILATAGYDRTIQLWSLATGKHLSTLEGHNGAVLALAFRPDGKVLASASADRTVKLWEIPSGRRLDTLKESTKELYTLAFTPDGKRIAAGGVDHRIRTWHVSSDAQEATNPLEHSVFAHDAAILRLVFSPDGNSLVTSAEDRTIKVWNAADLTIRNSLERQLDWTPALAISPDNTTLLVGRVDGRTIRYPLSKSAESMDAQTTSWQELTQTIDYGAQPSIDQLPQLTELEPNNRPETATPIPSLPHSLRGKLFDVTEPHRRDVDLFRFHAALGDQWIFETHAERLDSPADTKLEVLFADGRPVPKMLLRAVRDSSVTFRGINSDQLNCRLTNWEEMELNEYLYLNGEVVKLYRKPRGPDSGFNFFPNQGKRYSYFDTSPRSHPLFQPCYIVVPYPVGTTLPDNGLPTFPLFFENDDESQRRLGTDSQLTFVAPSAGEYLVRISDVREIGGDDFAYQLVVRRPLPDFKVTLGGADPVVNAGGGKEFTLNVERIDNFHGPIRVDITGLPPGFVATSPIVISTGQITAQGVVNALPHAPAPDESNWNQTKVIATAEVAGKTITREVNNFGTVKRAEAAKVVAHLLPAGTAKIPALAMPRPSRPWQVLAPQIFKSSRGTTLTTLDDLSLLASGDNPDSDTYQVVAMTTLPKLKSIRLDVLGHDSLPAKSPGRAVDNGNLVLSEFKVTAISLKDPSQSMALQFESVRADYSQPGLPITNTIDGDPQTGWAIAINNEEDKYPVKRTGTDTSHWAEFELSESPAFEGGTLLVFTLEQSTQHKQHNIGRFRLSVSNEALPPLDLSFPPIADVTIESGTMMTCELRVARHDFNDRISFDVNNLPHGVIVEDIGLNGVLIRENESHRTIFLRAESWVSEGTRLVHAVAKVEGNQVSLPIRLHVRKPNQVVNVKPSSN